MPEVSGTRGGGWSDCSGLAGPSVSVRLVKCASMFPVQEAVIWVDNVSVVVVCELNKTELARRRKLEGGCGVLSSNTSVCEAGSAWGNEAFFKEASVSDC